MSESDKKYTSKKYTSLEQLDLHSSGLVQPKYERLKSYLVEEVTSGRLQPGDAMPSELHLATTLKIARNTVRQAMGELVLNGMIRRVPGKGTFVDTVKIKPIDKPNESQAGELTAGGNSVQSPQSVAQFALLTPVAQAAYYPALLDGFENASCKVHHQTLINNSRNRLDAQARIILQLIDNQVSGVAFVPINGVPTPPFHVRQLQQRGIPVVLCHRPVEGTQAPLLAIPFYDIGRMAGEAMIRQGHRRVALVQLLADTQKSMTMPMANGFCDAIRAGGGDLPSEFIRKVTYRSSDIGIEFKENDVYAIAKEICSRPDRPTAIMTSYDTIASLFFLELSQMGLRVPEDISLMGYGGTDRRGTVTRRLSSVTLDGQYVGQKAIELLVEMSNGDRPINDTEIINLPLGMSEGRTLGPVPNQIGSGDPPQGLQQQEEREGPGRPRTRDKKGTDN